MVRIDRVLTAVVSPASGLSKKIAHRFQELNPSPGGWPLSFRQRLFQPTKAPAVCLCSCPEMAHWTKDHHCVVPACGCKEYRPAKAKNKYNAARTVIKGQAFGSGFEGKVGVDLEYRRMCGEKFTVRKQVDFPLKVNGHLITTYRADFLLEHEDGRQEIVEAKGKESRDFKIKWKLIQALHPDITFTMEQQRRGWRPR